ncbi:MAG: methyl-accepting chemotaxis protein [Elusimicrobia bacterium]|nr:methyl-accepting chemotaxis protein [Elusimicrobiota bacterium]
MAKRKKFWIDPPIQTRMLRFVVGMMAVSLLVAYFSMDRGLEQAAAQSERAFISVGWARDALLAPFYVAFFTTLLAGVVMTVLWSHKYIGPLMVLTAGIRRIREGDLTGEEKTRDTDELVGLVQDFISMRDALRRKANHDRQAVSRVEERLETIVSKAKSGDSLRDEVQAIRHELKTLGSFYKLQ